MEGQTGLSLPLDSARRWTIGNQLSVRYDHNVDMTTTEKDAASMRSVVNNWQLEDEVKLNFRPNDRMEFALLAGGTYYFIHSRRNGFNNVQNTTDWVWNAHLSRSLMKGALVVKLTGFDLLHQLTNTRYEMNAQGRTEVWYNSLPRYMMLSLAWKFNASTKRK